MSKYIFYPGCYISTMLPHVEVAIRFLLKKFNIETVELEELSCCPPKISGIADELFWLTTAIRNLAIAEKQGLDILTPCNGCFESFFEAKLMYEERENIRTKISTILSGLGYKYEGKAKPKHLVEVLYEDVGLNKIGENVVKPLNNLKVAVHYGCHLFVTEPGEDVWKKPKITDELIRVTGAKLVKDGLERLCCGFVPSTVDEPYSLTHRTEVRLKSVKELGIDAIVTPCPQCLIRLEFGQIRLRAKAKYDIPIIHVAELLALALGLDPKKFGFITYHKSPTRIITQKIASR